MRKVKRNKKQQQKKEKTVEYNNIYDLISLLKTGELTEKKFNDILFDDKKIYEEYMSIMKSQIEEQRKDRLNRIEEPPCLSGLKTECKEEVLDKIQELWDSLYNKAGGAAYDLPNFCTRSDFGWSRETINSAFISINDIDIIECEGEEFDYEIISYIEEQKYEMLSALDSIEEEIVYSAKDKIYEYIITEPRSVYQGKAGLDRLEKEFIEKGVVSSKEELYELESI